MVTLSERVDHFLPRGRPHCPGRPGDGTAPAASAFVDVARPETDTRSSRSRLANQRLRALIPGGAHTYAKGDEQYPENMAPVISRGRGAHVWDVDGNRYLEYGSGLRAVSLGHAHPRVLSAVRREIGRGTNFVRPSVMEIVTAERFLETVPTADMVKFAKNGSDVTTAAVRLARAATGRPLVAVCTDHPFFSSDDWFIGTTPMSAGVPDVVADLTVGFPYGDLAAAEQLLRRHGGRVACLILEPATHSEPPPGYLSGLRELADRHGCLLVFDEMITGFRWSEAGAQAVYGVVPDLSTFGKALGNGFAVSALAGRRELMEQGHSSDRGGQLFLLSSTHGAETHALAAATAVMATYREDGTAARLRALGTRLAEGVGQVTAGIGVQDHLVLRGHPSNLVFATLDHDRQASQSYRTLFLRQLLVGGVLAPSFAVSSALTEADVDRTVEVVEQACVVYRKALDAGDPSPWTGGRAVRPVFCRAH